MAGKMKYDKEIREEVMRRYFENGENMQALCEEYGVNIKTGYYWAHISNQNPKKKHTKRQNKVCHKCGNTDNATGAFFCCMCGAKLKTEADLMIDNLRYVAELTQFLPHSTR